MQWNDMNVSEKRAGVWVWRCVTGTMCLAIAAILSGCPPPYKQKFISYEESIQPIWDAHCMGCHDSEHHNGNLVLEKPAPSSFNHLVNKNATKSSGILVNRDQPVDSVLLHRLKGQNMPSGYPNPAFWKMPMGGGSTNVLTTEELDTIGLWVIIKSPYYLPNN